jgi:hypothetical protein
MTLSDDFALMLRVRISQSEIHTVQHKLGRCTGNVDLVYLPQYRARRHDRWRIAGKITLLGSQRIAR